MSPIDYLIITIGDLGLFHIAPELKRRGYFVAVISGSNQKEDIEFFQANNIPYWHINDLIDKYRDEIYIKSDVIERIKEIYKIPSIRNFYYPYLFYHSGDFEYHDFYNLSNNSENDILFNRTLEIIQAIECFFRDNHINFIVQNMGGEILRRTVYHCSKIKNIPNIIISWTPLSHHYTLLSNELGQWDEFVMKDYSQLSAEEIRQAKEYIMDFRSKGTNITLRKTNKSNLNKIQMILDQYKILRKRQDPFLALKNTLVKGYYKATYSYKVSKLFREPDFDENFFFFPLHYPAESRLTFWNAHCWRQEFIAEYVARSLPQGYKLYVKPHPEWVTAFPLEGLKMLSKVSNIQLIQPHIPSVQLIQNSVGVVVVNSTTGYEAILYNIPVISFGTEFYNAYPLVLCVENFRDLPMLIYQALHQKPNNEAMLISFVNALLRASRPGNFGALEEKDIILIVNGILDYSKKLIDDQF